MTLQLKGNQLDKAAEILRSGGTVAFPTETVFGLGASCLQPHAIEKIFEAKGRPSDNPLIVHLYSTQQLHSICRHVSTVAQSLMQKWTPGPLTIVLEKSDAIPDSVTAGLDTVAFRFPKHPIARELLRIVDAPIAAPSANRSGRPSGTRWQSVLEDLDGRIDAIVCEDGCDLGLESTVLDLHSQPARILRPGSISIDQLRVDLPSICDATRETASLDNSPGLRYRHYQPTATVRLITPQAMEELVRIRADGKIHPRLALIGLEDQLIDYPAILCQPCKDCEEYASRLYEFFREADREGVTEIWCLTVDKQGIGVALMDRLQRAAE